MVTAYSIRFSAFPVSKIQILFNSAKFIFKTCGEGLRGGEKKNNLANYQRFSNYYYILFAFIKSYYLYLSRQTNNTKMKKTETKVVQVVLRDATLIKKFTEFVKNQKRSESNAGEIIFNSFFKVK